MKNKKQLKTIGLLSVILFAGLMLFVYATNQIFSHYDFKALDFFYKQAVKKGVGPQPCFHPRIVYLNITDDTYDFFDKNYLDRKDMAKVNNALSTLDIEAAIYDILFVRGSTEKSDKTFTRSLRNLRTAYLPMAMALTDTPTQFKWKNDIAHDRLRNDYLGKPIEKNTDSPLYALPFYGAQALMQHPDFASAAYGSGDITAPADPDSIYRHTIMLVKVDDSYFPALSLSVFLDWAGVTFEDIIVEWGKRITIPASEDNYLETDVVIPIDRRGRTFIPFVQTMGNDFKQMSVHTFLTHYADKNLRGNLLSFFEGSFVFVADVAIGTSDLGYTPIERDVPLVIIHASLLNAMLTNTFYSQWSFKNTLGLVCLFLTCMACASLAKSSWFLYSTGIVIICVIFTLTWHEFVCFRLFPVTTVLTISLVIFFSLIITLETAASKDRSFIKNTFARYVPETVVNTLLANPDMIKLGGEERMVTVLFSDIADFTTISEIMPPQNLVKLLNEYFTEMSNIIIQHGGIIDKFQGDAVMAEFGIPVAIGKHADNAVATALSMLYRLSKLRQQWAEKGLPLLHCRIGINTNNMIVGNMGSKNALDYTVIGDAVNLASRLEGVNKIYGTSLMISEFTLKALTPNRFQTRILDIIQVKGKSEAVKVYEVYGAQHDPISPQQKAYYAHYNNAYAAYLARHFTLATQHFQDALTVKPGDPAARQMLHRIKHINIENLSLDWDGSIGLTTK